MNHSEGPPVATASAEAVASELLPVDLVILDHYSRQTKCVLRSLPAILGRNEQAEVKLSDPWISHQHCKLVEQDGQLIIRDLDSKNGVFLHGARVLEAEVHSGDVLTLGRTEITVRFREPAVPSDATVGQTGDTTPLPRPPRVPRSTGPHTEELLY
jgi:pSer/pThr/pTyr-binding forkhead associated (FHA) protein